MLSYRDRRILLGIERRLSAEDPELARRFRSHTTVSRVLSAALRLAAGILAVGAAVSLLLGAPQALPTLITFTVALVLLSHLITR